jgi:hypothetical protein
MTQTATPPATDTLVNGWEGRFLGEVSTALATEHRTSSAPV